MITIGTDPEFLLIDRYGEIRCAEEYDFFSSSSSSSEIGCDGSGTPVEIRPPPTTITNINKLLVDINRILTRISKYTNSKKLKLYAGANYEGNSPIGGHIHFGASHLKKRRTREKLIALLDSYFTPITNFFISQRALANRLDTGYGGLGQFETKHYGFEYRTPYSFLISPFHTNAFFNLASLIAYHYKKMSIDYELLYNVQKYYKRMDYSRLQKLYPTIKGKILKLMSYKSPNPRFNSNILSLFNLIERNQMYQCYDVLKNYNLSEPVPQFMEIVFSRDEHMKLIHDLVGRSINNKTGGRIFVYGVKLRPDENNTQESVIFLSKNLPEPKYLRGIKVEYKTFGSGSIRPPSIGLSYVLRREIAFGDRSVNFLVNYLNRLKYKKEEDVYVQDGI